MENFYQKSEIWKYTNIDNFISQDSLLTKEKNSVFIINGKMCKSHNRINDKKKLEISVIENIFPENTRSDINYTKNFESEFSGQINIKILKNSSLKVEIFNLVTQKNVNYSLDIELEEGAEVEIFEMYKNFSEEKSTIQSIRNLKISSKAILNHYFVQNLNHHSMALFTTNVQIHDQAKYIVKQIHLGSRKTKHDTFCTMKGEKSHCDAQCLNIAKKNQSIDTCMITNHCSSLSTSNQKSRQIALETGKVIFYGSILIPKGLHDIEAHQDNKNLVLSHKAQAMSRPELKIYSKKVRCSHASTTDRLSGKVVNYIKSRGISEKETRKILIDAFVNEMLDSKLLEFVSINL